MSDLPVSDMSRQEDRTSRNVRKTTPGPHSFHLFSAFTEITHCGGVGTGMVMKLMNNFIVFMNTSALAEALLIGTRAGVDSPHRPTASSLARPFHSLAEG